MGRARGARRGGTWGPGAYFWALLKNSSVVRDPLPSSSISRRTSCRRVGGGEREGGIEGGPWFGGRDGGKEGWARLYSKLGDTALRTHWGRGWPTILMPKEARGWWGADLREGRPAESGVLLRVLVGQPAQELVGAGPDGGGALSMVEIKDRRCAVVGEWGTRCTVLVGDGY